MSFGVFEGLTVQAGNNSARNQRLSEARDLDRAVFRAREQFGDYLSNARDRKDLEGRIAHIRPNLVKLVSEVTSPYPKVMRQVVAALKSSSVSSGRPRQAGTVDRKNPRTPWAEGETAPDGSRAPRKAIPSKSGPYKDKMPDKVAAVKVGSVTKIGWSYDHSTKLYTHQGSFRAFSCPGCGTAQQHLGLNFCKCGRTFNSWVVRNASSSTKTGSPSDVLMCREVKMRGDQFKLASTSLSKRANEGEESESSDTETEPSSEGPSMSEPGGPRPQPPQEQAVQPGGMPGPCPCGTPGCPGCAPGSGPVTPMDPDGDMDPPGTEGGPLDQVADALSAAIQGIRQVQELAVGDPRSVTAARNLEQAMNKYWDLEKRSIASRYARAQRVAAVANRMLKKARLTRTSATEEEFLRGWDHAVANKPLPEKTSAVWLEGYVAGASRNERNSAQTSRKTPTTKSTSKSTRMTPGAGRKKADSYTTDGDTSGNYKATGPDESPGLPKGEDWAGSDETEGAPSVGDFRPDLAREIDKDNNAPRDKGTVNSVPKSGRQLPKGRQGQRNASTAARPQPRRSSTAKE